VQAAGDGRPFNPAISKELPDDSPCAPREALGTEDARPLARGPFGTSQPAFISAFKGSPK